MRLQYPDFVHRNWIGTILLEQQLAVLGCNWIQLRCYEAPVEQPTANERINKPGSCSNIDDWG